MDNDVGRTFRFPGFDISVAPGVGPVVCSALFRPGDGNTSITFSRGPPQRRNNPGRRERKARRARTAVPLPADAVSSATRDPVNDEPPPYDPRDDVLPAYTPPRLPYVVVASELPRSTPRPTAREDPSPCSAWCSCYTCLNFPISSWIPALPGSRM